MLSRFRFFSIFALLQAVVERRAVERRLTRIISDNKESEAALNKELRDAKHERNLVIAQLRHLEKHANRDADFPLAAPSLTPVRRFRQQESNEIGGAGGSDMKEQRQRREQKKEDEEEEEFLLQHINSSATTRTDQKEKESRAVASTTATSTEQNPVIATKPQHRKTSKHKAPQKSIADANTATPGALLSRRLDRLAALSSNLLSSDSDMDD